MWKLFPKWDRIETREYNHKDDVADYHNFHALLQRETYTAPSVFLQYLYLHTDEGVDWVCPLFIVLVLL